MGKYRKSTKLPAGSTRRFPMLPRLISTSLGAGFLPVCPGTWGALVGIILWLPLYIWAAPAVCVWTTAILSVVFGILGVWSSSEAEKYWGQDPVVACIDETVGQWISMIPIAGITLCPWWEIVVAFALFRFFDIFKPLGIRVTERLPRGWGMMADDVLAGIYSAIIILAVNHFFVFPANGIA